MNAAPKRQAPGGVALALCVALALTACDALRPRQPADPLGDIPLVPLNDVDAVLEQLIVGVDSLVVPAYINAFADEFIFEPDATDAGAFPGTFLDWGQSSEERAIQTVFDLVDSIRFEHETCDDAIHQGCGPSSDGDTEKIFDYRYTFEASTEIGQGSPCAGVTTFAGIATLTFRLDTGEWRIVRWADRQDPNLAENLPTATVLRGCAGR